MKNIDLTKTSSSRGFTLIELLVVIAIIAILAAILFPVFATAREKARQASCSSNEKQLGIAFIQYVQDFDETYPYGSVGAAFNPPGPGWGGQIFPYVKSTGVFQCPDDPSHPSPARPAEVPVSYFYSLNLPGNPLSKLNAPAKTVLLFENFGALANLADPNETTTDGVHSGVGNGCGSLFGRFYETGYMSAWGPAAGYETASGAGYPSVSGVHTGASNFLLGDGHIKWLHGSQVSSGYNNNIGPGDEGATSCPNGVYCQAAGTGYGANGPTGAPFSATFSLN